MAVQTNVAAGFFFALFPMNTLPRGSPHVPCRPKASGPSEAPLSPDVIEASFGGKLALHRSKGFVTHGEGHGAKGY